jgi:hypothetical protein
MPHATHHTLHATCHTLTASHLPHTLLPHIMPHYTLYPLSDGPTNQCTHNCHPTRIIETGTTFIHHKTIVIVQHPHAQDMITRVKQTLSTGFLKWCKWTSPICLRRVFGETPSQNHRMQSVQNMGQLYRHSLHSSWQNTHHVRQLSNLQ